MIFDRNDDLGSADYIVYSPFLNVPDPNTPTFPIPCTYTISPTSLTFTSAGGTGSVNVTAGTGCAWTATENLDWVTNTSGSSGTGSGTVSYSVLDNTSLSSRTGTLTIAGQTFTVTQAGTCSGGAVNLQNVTFLSGQTYNCVATTSITAGTGVTVQSGANVTFQAPIINLQPGFTVESGAVFNMRQ